MKYEILSKECNDDDDDDVDENNYNDDDDNNNNTKYISKVPTPSMSNLDEVQSAVYVQ